MFISKKDELYTFDELELLKGIVISAGSDSSDSLIDKIESLQKKLEDKKSSMAIFFMPRNTFTVFSMFQGDSSICSIEAEDLQIIYDSLCNTQADSSLPAEHKTHLENKVKVLLDFLEQGNEVFPMATPADYLIEV